MMIAKFGPKRPFFVVEIDHQVPAATARERKEKTTRYDLRYAWEWAVKYYYITPARPKTPR